MHHIDRHVDAYFAAFWRALAAAEWDTYDVCLRARRRRLALRLGCASLMLRQRAKNLFEQKCTRWSG